MNLAKPSDPCSPQLSLVKTAFHFDLICSRINGLAIERDRDYRQLLDFGVVLLCVVVEDRKEHWPQRVVHHLARAFIYSSMPKLFQPTLPKAAAMANFIFVLLSLFDNGYNPPVGWNSQNPSHSCTSTSMKSI